MARAPQTARSARTRSALHVELTIDHTYQRALSSTARLPLFRPERKTA